MPANREPCFAALFARIEALTEGDAPTLKFASRALRSWDDTPPSECPAAYLTKGPESVDDRRGLPPIWSLEADLIIYAKNDEGRNTVPSIQINALLDAIEEMLQRTPTEGPADGAIFPNNPDMMWGTTLGGLCYTCTINGTVEVYEGVVGGGAVAIVPILIVTSGVGT